MQSHRSISSHLLRTAALSGAIGIGMSIVLTSPTAAADARLENASGRPVLEEARFVHDIRIDGVFATVGSSNPVFDVLDEMDRVELVVMRRGRPHVVEVRVR